MKMCSRKCLFATIVLTTATCMVVVTASVSVKEDPRDPIVENGSDSRGARVNYSSILGTDEDMDEGSSIPEMDFSSIDGILQSLRLLVARRDIRYVIPRPKGVNGTCYDDIINFVDAVLGYPPTNSSSHVTKTPNWALEMFDAFGKPGSGLLEGSLQWVGSYSECLDVHALIPAGTQFGTRTVQSQTEFDTQYCRVEIMLNPALWKRSSYASKMNDFWKSKHSPDLVLNWGMCLPQSCSGTDVENFLNEGILSSLKLKVQDAVCYEENSTIHKDPGAMTVIVLLSFFAFIVFFCTSIESYWHYTPAGEDEHQPANGAGTPMLKDGTDLTIIIPVVENDKVVSNGSSSPCKTKFTFFSERTEHTPIGNGGTGHISCNGTTNHGKDLNSEQNELHKDVNEHGEIHRDTKTNGSSQCQANIVCDEAVGKEHCTLDVDKAHPVGFNGTAGKDKDERKSYLQEKTKPKREGMGTRIVKAFSMRLNLIRLLKTSGTSRPGVIRCLEGMRVISMLWIILGHTYTFGAVMDNGNLMFANIVEVSKTTARLSFFLVTGATFAVDTFFLMSGLLVAMLTLKDLKKNEPSCRFWSLFYFHRIWRLTPVYMVVMMFCITMYDHTVVGPLKSLPLKEFDDCHSKWWTHLLYINNLYEPQQKCMTWTWYLAVDMQLFAIAPLVIYVVHRSLRVGLICILSLVIAGMLSAFVSQNAYFGQFVMMDQIFSDYWEHVYIRPWTRIGAFAVGMFTGVIILNGDQKPTFSKAKALCIWVAVAAVAFFIIFIPHVQWKEGSKLWGRSLQALYEALSRPAWAVCVAIVVYLCHTGRGGVANNILGWPGFQPLARITYAVYLVHPVVMTFFVYSRNTPVYLQDTTIMYQYIGNVVFSYIFGTLLCIMFESPIMTLEKILLHSR